MGPLQESSTTTLDRTWRVLRSATMDPCRLLPLLLLTSSGPCSASKPAGVAQGGVGQGGGVRREGVYDGDGGLG